MKGLVGINRVFARKTGNTQFSFINSFMLFQARRQGGARDAHAPPPGAKKVRLMGS